MKARVLILDNYDSFTYNLVHIVRELGYPYEVHRNDKIDIEQIGRFDKIILSPGPGIPDEAGIMKEVIHEIGSSKSILGICLGHQGIAEVYGGVLYNLPNVLHGVTSEVKATDEEEILFRGLPKALQVCHYHSWVVKPDSVPDELTITATGDDGMVMGLRHRKYDVRGLQFHPESVMTPHGPAMINNWLKN